MNELDCMVCGETTLISDEVRAAFMDMLENPEFSLGGAAEEQDDVEAIETEQEETRNARQGARRPNRV